VSVGPDIHDVAEIVDESVKTEDNMVALVTACEVLKRPAADAHLFSA
jgi:hypothetical protein